MGTEISVPFIWVLKFLYLFYMGTEISVPFLGTEISVPFVNGY